MFANKKISLVFPAYNEEKNIGSAIKDFKSLGIFDEIIVVDNNCSDNTARISLKKGVKVIKEEKQGYGFALRKGMSVAKGDYIVLSEPDGTFDAGDTLCLLKYLDNFDFVVGTRTNTRFIDEKANMSGLLRWGNILLAKLIQLLYHTNHLSDCGCTFRVMKKAVVKSILPKLTVGGSHFLSELLVLTLINGFKVQEIPVHYCKRIGESKITGSIYRSILVGVKMLITILKYKFVR